jgi:hypothetical protein
MTDYRRVVTLTGPICALLVSCGSHQSPKQHTPPREEWKIQASLEVSEGELEPGKYRLIVPFTVGDMYGGPDSKTYITPSLNEDGTFELDLNLDHDAMLAELAEIPPSARFRDHRMSIAPRDARIATISPQIVNKRFKALGNASWADAQTGHRLQLMYFDRPAHLTGNDLDVEVSEAGYVWVEVLSSPEISHAVPQPDDLVLAFFGK